MYDTMYDGLKTYIIIHALYLTMYVYVCLCMYKT